MDRLGASIAVVIVWVALFSPRDVSAQDALQLVPIGALAPRVRIDAPGDLVVYAARIDDGLAAASDVPISAALRPREQRICVAPCERRLTAGRYALAVGRPGDRPIAVEDAVAIVRDRTDLRVRVHSNAGTRTFGHILGAAGLVLSIASCFVPSLIEHEGTAAWTLGIGLSVGVTLGTVGAMLALESDDVLIERRSR